MNLDEAILQAKLLRREAAKARKLEAFQAENVGYLLEGGLQDLKDFQWHMRAARDIIARNRLAKKWGLL